MRAAFVIATTTVLGACATFRSAPEPARFAGEVPIQMTLRGSAYAGTLQTTRARDSVSGTFSLAGPVTVRGSLAGRITDRDLSITLSYTTAQNCTGTMRLAGPVTAGPVVDGTTEAQDSCVGRLSGTFKLGKP